jgi:RsiW-degrading membrane proteinase PrsW (M82 family)
MQEILIITTAAVAGVVPMLIYMTAIYWLDRYEREPWWMVAMVFLWGALGGALFGCVLNTLVISIISSFLDVSAAGAVGAVGVAPLVEEVTKILPLFVLILLRHFDNTTDGLIYGAACGLGFAMTENIFYFYNVGSVYGFSELFFHNILIRTCFTAVVHGLASASWGFFLGLGRYRGPWLRWLLLPLLGYGAAISIHAFWNGSVTWAGLKDEQSWQWLAYLVIGALAVCMFLLSQLSLFLEHRTIKRELAAEAQSGTLPQGHAAIIPYWSKRRGDAWLQPHVDKARYIKAATRLAFRRHQARLARGETQAALERDVARYRDELRILQEPPRAQSGDASSWGDGGWG